MKFGRLYRDISGQIASPVAGDTQLVKKKNSLNGYARPVPPPVRIRYGWQVLFVSVPAAAWAGVLGMAQLIAAAFLAGAAQLFFGSCYGRFLRTIVPAGQRPEASAKLEGGLWASPRACPSSA
jgi:hypothetical protein